MELKSLLSVVQWRNERFKGELKEKNWRRNAVAADQPKRTVLSDKSGKDNPIPMRCAWVEHEDIHNSIHHAQTYIYIFFVDLCNIVVFIELNFLWIYMCFKLL